MYRALCPRYAFFFAFPLLFFLFFRLGFSKATGLFRVKS